MARGGGGIGCEPAALAADQADITDRGPERLLPRRQHADEVRHRGAGDEQAHGRFRKAEHLARPAGDLLLDRDRHVVSPAAIGVQPGRQHLGQKSHRRPGALDPAHEAGMQVSAGIGHHVAPEDLMDIGQGFGSGRQGRSMARPNRLGDRPPDRLVTQALQMVEQVVEHTVALPAQPGPVRRIEGFRHARLSARSSFQPTLARNCREPLPPRDGFRGDRSKYQFIHASGRLASG
jgi:hypothetical protein